MSLFAHLYEKVRDKLGKICAEVVRSFACACFQVRMEPCASMAPPKRQSSSTVGQWHAFSGCVVRAISINVFMIFIYLNIFIRG